MLNRVSQFLKTHPIITIFLFFAAILGVIGAIIAIVTFSTGKPDFSSNWTLMRELLSSIPSVVWYCLAVGLGGTLIGYWLGQRSKIVDSSTLSLSREALMSDYGLDIVSAKYGLEIKEATEDVIEKVISGLAEKGKIFVDNDLVGGDDYDPAKYRSKELYVDYIQGKLFSKSVPEGSTLSIEDLVQNSEVSTKSLATKKQGNLLEKIGFNYQESPIEHGWRILETPDKTQPAISHFVDGFIGNAIRIRSSIQYAMDYTVKPLAKFGSLVELTVKIEGEDAFVYTLQSVCSKDGSNSKSVWLVYPVGNGKPSRYGDGSDEWGYPVKPVRCVGDWLLFQINLKSAVEQTFGQDGWEFEHLKGFRVRGNLSLANISVFEEG